MHSKKGQGLSLTTIIVAAIALIVLVVLVMIFTGRIGIFSDDLEEISQKELIGMSTKYGNCRPGTASESTFLENIKNAGEDENIKDSYRSEYNRLIGECKAKNEAECGAPCIWTG